MERLTEYLGGIPHIKRTINGINGKANYLRDFDIEAVRKLAYYEDLEEQGRLVVLPCKVGDTVYHPLLGEGEVKTIYIRSMALILVVFDDESHLFPFSEFGESVFTSRAEAEAALKGAKDAR